MPTSVKNGGTWKTITALHVKDGGTWKEALALYRNQGGTWVRVHEKPGSGTSPGGGFVQFNIVGFTPNSGGTASRLSNGQLSVTPQVLTSGGTGSFTYSWAVLSDDSGGSLSNASNQTCSFSTATQTVPYEATTTLRCTVTDTGDSNRQQTADFVRNWIWGAI
jgi:hypothetical protein